MIADWARGVLGRPTYKRLEKSLSGNPHHRLVSKIVERYKALGGSLCGNPWTQYLDVVYKGQMVGEGRINTSLQTGITDWLTLTSYAVNQFNCPAVTLESFDPIRAGTWGIEERGLMHFQFLQATIEEFECQD